jgi:anthranilate synthase component 1
MTLEEFRALAQDHAVVPVMREVLFDTNTAVTAYARIREGPFAFLLESVVGGEKWARYTFLGSAPRDAVRIVQGRLESWEPAGGWQPVTTTAQPLAWLEARLAELTPAPVPGLPRFFGGALGYLGYDMVRYVETLPDAPADDLGLPEALLIFTDTVIAIDNVFGKALVICCARVTCECAGECACVDAEFARAQASIDRIMERLGEPHQLEMVPRSAAAPAAPASSYAREDFERDVERIRDYIRAGDAFQVVLSQRLQVPLGAPPLDIYRKLRSLNPSPYLYLLELDGLALVGSSPEVLVRVEDRRVVLRPIAGTRRRGRNEAEDMALAAELLADEKERAEHLMLVDLGRNDVGRVAEFGSVEVKGLMQIERYSHVLHIVSQVEGTLREGLSAVDVFRACFPAGTVSGAPKVRAMQIIDELEPVRRGPYAGAVGYFGYGGQTMDTAIAIRTVVVAGGMAYVQAGAGVVMDSVPAREWQETLEKAGALLAVLGA